MNTKPRKHLLARLGLALSVLLTPLLLTTTS